MSVLSLSWKRSQVNLLNKTNSILQIASLCKAILVFFFFSSLVSRLLSLSRITDTVILDSESWFNKLKWLIPTYRANKEKL